MGSSFAGCDGGNRNAKTWICGIEYGGSDGEETDREWYKETLPKQIADGEGMDPPHECSIQANLKSPFNSGFAKLYTAYKNPDLPLTEYRGHLDDYSDSERLKPNLFPIAFQHVGNELWHKFGLNVITKLENKELYRIWCRVNRFPVFADLVKENRPNLIIGAGVSHLSDYFACFAGSVGLKTAISVGKLEPISEANSKTRSYYYAELNNETILAVVPFYSGTNGLNSYHLLSEMGKRLKQITQGQNLN